MIEAVGALVVATTILMGSPGPATLALAATGATFGFRNGLPFLIGILAGLAVVITIGAAGLGTLLEAYPASKLYLQLAGGAYIFYVAFKIATADVTRPGAGVDEQAPSLANGFILNLLNAKAYAAFLALFSSFLLPLSGLVWSYFVTAVIAYTVIIVVDVAWLGLGGLLRPLFEEPRRARITRVCFGLLIVASVIYTFMQS